MSTLTLDDFADFYRAVNDGHHPFAWQVRLLRSVMDRGLWPDGIHAPTGSGKSSAVDVHVFANALASVGGVRVPRRLVVAVNRRALVDQHFEHGTEIAERLAKPDSPVLTAVRDALAQLVSAQTDARPLRVANLRGGLSLDRTWLDDPSVCSIICATPDMWGSRILFRGYGSSRPARPREAGTLALDSVLVVDEAHLNRQLTTAARSIANLVAWAPHQLQVPALQVVETTATPPSGQSGMTSVGVEQQDLSVDALLEKRLMAPKPVQLLTHRDALKSKPTKPYVEFLVQTAMELRDRVCAQPSAPSLARTIGIVVNSRAVAAAVAEKLQQGVSSDVPVWMGRMRPYDLEQQKAKNPELFTVQGDDRIEFLVATQTVEVGVDLDWAGLVTELASGAALGQRFGRVNRLGLRAEGYLTVVGPEETTTRERYGVYRGSELTAALEWLQPRVNDRRGCSPAALLEFPPPAAELRRTLLQRVEAADSWYLSRTSENLSVDPTLALWLRDDLESREDLEAGLVIRDLQGLSLSEAVAVLNSAPPAPVEVFPETLKNVKEARTLAAAHREDHPEELEWAFIWRGGSLLTMPVTPSAESEAGSREADTSLIPGDVLILSTSAPLARGPVLSDDPKTRIHPVDFTGATDGPRVIRLERLVKRVEGADVSPDDIHELDLLSRLALVMDDAAGEGERVQQERLQAEFERWWLQRPQAPDRSDTGPLPVLTMPPPGVLAEREDDSVRTNVVDPLAWVVISPREAQLDREDCRQAWSGTSTPVTLDQHSRDVAQRAGKVASLVGLPQQLRHALHAAGLDHDLGKADERMQRALDNPDPHGQPWAKSRAAVQGGRKSRKPDFGLAARWRHEQLSVVLSQGGADPECRELVWRLVGTSHGHGRPAFAHTFAELRGKLSSRPMVSWNSLQDLGESLFDCGDWETLIERTDRQWSVWGAAYLEALLRAADCQVSKEGESG